MNPQPAVAQIGEAIEAWIQANGTAVELARRMDVRQEQISRWRRGHTFPMYQSLTRLEEILGVRLEPNR